MTYLSRLMLNQACRSVRRDIADCQQMHRTVMRGFPNDLDSRGGARASAGVLYRLEYDGKTGAPRLLVQSGVAPDWSRLPDGYLREPESDMENPACKDVSAAYAQFGEGDVLVFKFAANPTRKVGTSVKSGRESGGPKCNGRRVFITGEEDQLRWLARKATEAGFELLTLGAVADETIDVQALNERVASGRRRPVDGEDATEDLVLKCCTFTGRLRIVDKLRFGDALAHGIGSGKAYGFGLLSVARPRV